jgi:hypothetical protein|tara:strand:+ start:1762 stop:1965 length:204 start_codon:yes stop_codon:yes gene_type:complete
MKKNWFETLNAALESENLVDKWEMGLNISYGQTVSCICDGLYISVYRESDGRYERPISYSTKMSDSI